MFQTRERTSGAGSVWRRASMAMGLGGVLVIAACTPPGSSNDTAGAQQDVSTAVPDEQIELVFNYYEDGGLGEAIEQLLADYEEMHPNISIKPRYTSFSDYGRTIRLTMSSDTAPDVAQAGQGYVHMGPLVDAGLLLPLDDYAEAYNWDERLPEGFLNQSRFQDDAESFGSGNLYGMPLGGNLVGVYYNEALLEQLGISLPLETLADFESALAAARDAGITPLSLGNLEGFPAGHVLSALMARYQSEDQEMLAWTYGEEGASFDAASTLEALETLQRWAQEGFILQSANGTAETEGLARFNDGTSLFMITGNWNAAQVDAGLGEDAGFMLLPPVEPEDPTRAPGATTAPFGIHPESPYPDAAANLLDYMTSEEAAPTLLEGGAIPLSDATIDMAESIGGTRGDAMEAFAEVRADDGLMLYLDWSTVTMNDTLFPELQRLIAGETTPQDVITTVQQDWQAAKGS